MLDAHLHVWDPALCSYGWLTPSAGDLHGRFSVESARAAAGPPVSGALLVQAADSLAETELLLRWAEGSDGWVRGVVGWLPLRDPAQVLELVRDGSAGRLVGVRHLFHDDPDPRMLTRPEVLRSLALLRDAGLVLDVPDAFPAGLMDEAGRAAQAVDGLTVVLDHLGKPPVGGDLTGWRHAVRVFAEVPGTVAKVSGLVTSLVPGAFWTTKTLRPVWETALAVFGPDRLMIGSDWPLAPTAGDYAGSVGVLLDLVAELTSAEQAEVLAGTAERVYLDAGRLR